jgi:hypothetical protein
MPSDKETKMTEHDWIKRLIKAQNKQAKTWTELDKLHWEIADCLTELNSIIIRKEKAKIKI